MLPNTGMSFTPFDPLTAAELNDVVENIESLSDGTGIQAGVIDTGHLADGAVTTVKMDDASVTPDKLATGAAASNVSGSESTASTSYVNLATVQSISVTVGANGLLLVGINFEGRNSIADALCIASFSLSGANTLASSDVNKIQSRLTTATATQRLGVTRLLTGLNPGVTTVTMQFRTTAGTATFNNRELWALPL